MNKLFEKTKQHNIVCSNTGEFMIYDENQTALFMDDIASFYDVICHPCSNSRVSFLKKIISSVKQKNYSFIDMSCSTGETLFQLCKDDEENVFYGTDFSAGMINRAIAKCNKNKNVTFLTADMRIIDQYNLPQVDIAYSNSLEWLPSFNDFNNVIAATSNLLKNEGFFILDIVNAEIFRKVLKPYYGSYSYNGNIYYKNVFYETLGNDKYRINQTYVHIEPKSGKLRTYSAFLGYMLLNLDTTTESLTEHGFAITKIFNTYDTANADRLQIVCKKM